MNDRIESILLATIKDVDTPVSEDDAWDAFKSVIDAQHQIEYELIDEQILFEDFLQDTVLNIV